MISRMKKRIAGGFTLIELMVVVAIIGILAAVAIPAFMKNARKAKTTEAAINIKKMAEGASSYYLGEQTAAGSAVPIAKQFPITPVVNPTAPLMGACCPTKCSPLATLWTDPTWQALKFSMDDPHYYSYSYVRDANSAAGTAIGNLATGAPPTEYFFATANGDLNCDGVFSTFEYMGAIDTSGGVTTSAGMFTNNELE